MQKNAGKLPTFYNYVAMTAKLWPFFILEAKISGGYCYSKQRVQHVQYTKTTVEDLMNNSRSSKVDVKTILPNQPTNDNQ